MAVEETIRIEVVYATPAAQDVVLVEVPRGASVQDAVFGSGLLARHPGIDADNPPLGVYGRRVSADTRVEAGDRVEIYRELIVEPKQMRRLRAVGG